ncbi:hypothetical protein FAI41_01950 [Acetobacteraceae bacterium]|nr:hypothetical protein FAI41_01950 [Acetobacteraceae bacterium]
MAYGLLDAARVAKAAELSLQTLNAEKDPTEAQQRKALYVERIGALAKAAAETDREKGIGEVTLTAEEFWMLSKNW